MSDIDLIAIGERLRVIRGRLTQSAFAERLEMERKTVGRYESGERAPDALALLRLMSEFGADPAWVLTGTGAAPQITEDERELLALYRSASLTGKMAAVGALQGAMNAAPSQAEQRSRDSRHIAGRDMVNSGNVVEGSMQVFHQAPKGNIASGDIKKTSRKRGK